MSPCLEYLVPIFLIAYAVDAYNSHMHRRTFDREKRPRVLDLLRSGPLTEQELLERDPELSNHGVIDPDLYEMEKRCEISSRPRSDGTREFLLNEEQQDTSTAKGSSLSREVA